MQIVVQDKHITHVIVHGCDIMERRTSAWFARKRDETEFTLVDLEYRDTWDRSRPVKTIGGKRWRETDKRLRPILSTMLEQGRLTYDQQN